MRKGGCRGAMERVEGRRKWRKVKERKRGAEGKKKEIREVRR